MKVTYPANDPYGPLLHKLVAGDYPVLVQDGQMLLDLVSESIFASKSVRFGPRPSPEAQVKIREYLSRAMAASEPIRFVVPWGSEKPDGSGPDLAEMSAFKMLHCLDGRIKRHYKLGAQFSIRVEDASAPYLFFDRPELALREAMDYSDALGKLAELFGEGVISLARESGRVTSEVFGAEADKYLADMNACITAMDTGSSAAGSAERLASFGWVFTLNPDTLNYYMTQYEKMYPGTSRQRKIFILARYMASVLARKQLKLNGALAGWGEYMDLSFAGPIPGTEGLFGKRVFYRTAPSSMTTAHMPPWRSKGYAEVDGDSGSAVVKLASYNSLPSSLNPFRMKFSSEEGSEVEITADYVVAR